MRSPTCLSVLSVLFLSTFLTTTVSAQSFSTADVPGRWTRIGPDGGSVESLAVAPSQPATLYAGTDGGGVFRSTNSGSTWTFAGSGLGRLPVVQALTVDAAQPGMVYARTRDGLFRTLNSGGAWAQMDLPADSVPSDTVLVADPRRSGVVYAGLADHGVLVSADRGHTWKLLSGPPDTVTVLVIDPVHPTTLYAGTLGSGVYKSTDGGAHWKSITQGIHPSVTLVVGIAIDPRQPQTLLFLSLSNGPYRSADGGEHWTRSSSGLPGGIREIAIDPVSSTPFAGGPQAGVFRGTYSSNYGLTWRPAGAGLPDPDVHAVLAATSGLFVGSDSGVTVSRNRAQTWTAGHGVQAAEVIRLAIDAQNPPRMYAFDGSRLFKSANRGVSWSRLSTPTFDAPGMSGPVAVHPDDPQHLELGYVGLLAESDDGGQHWTDHFSVGCMIPSLILFDPGDAEVLYANGGFANAACGLNPDACYSFKFDHGQVSCLRDPAIDQHGVKVLAVDPAHPNHLFAGVDKLYQSQDAGATWSVLSADVQPGLLLLDPVNPSKLYAADFRSGVERSADGGVTWQGSTGLPASPSQGVISLVIDPTHSSTLYAATLFAVYRSTDSGATWKPLGTGLEEVEVWQIVLDPLDPRTLYAATTDGGVMRLQM